MKTWAIIVLGILCGCSARQDGINLPVVEKAATQPTAYELYISPIGSDANSGTIGSPLASLQKANAILRVVQPQSDVVIRLLSDRGVYIDQAVVWEYYNPEYNTTFEPYPDSLDACFAGNGHDGIFFKFVQSPMDATNLHFRKLYIRGYSGGAFWIEGDKYHTYGFNGYNTITDCTFQEIGNLWYPNKLQTNGVVVLTNSDYNIMERCTFIDCADAITETWGNVIIAVYFAHFCNNNLITDCTFRNIKGDGIRIRDASNYNEICHSNFYRTGWTGVVTMWYCHPMYWPDCFKDSECPSWNNSFHDNIVEGNWDCDKAVAFHDLRPQFHFGCLYDPNWKRISLYNNTVSKCIPSNATDRDKDSVQPKK